MGWLKKFLKINWIDSWFSINWSKVNCTLKSQTLTFWQKSSVKDHNLSKNVKIWNLFIKKSKSQDFILKSQSFQTEIFLSVENFIFFHNFELMFHHDARWFKGNFQHESFRSPWDLKHFFTQLLLEILGSQVINPWRHDLETKHLVKFWTFFVRILT